MPLVRTAERNVICADGTQFRASVEGRKEAIQTEGGRADNLLACMGSECTCARVCMSVSWAKNRHADRPRDRFARSHLLMSTQSGLAGRGSADAADCPSQSEWPRWQHSLHFTRARGAPCRCGRGCGGAIWLLGVRPAMLQRIREVSSAV